MTTPQSDHERRLRELEPSVQQMRSDIAEMRRSMERIEHTMVTKVEFSPVKALAFGSVVLILTAFVSALLALVLRGSK